MTKSTDILPIHLNEHAIAIILKETVRRVIGVIRSQMIAFDAHVKQGYSGQMDDIVTSADTAAQEVYLEIISECFPGIGIIAEEDQLSIDCKIQGVDAYLTIDPLDGTKAFTRRQSHGTSTMIAMVVDGEVIAVCIGDINTQEIFYYRPLSSHVHRITEYEKAEKLNYNLETLKGSYAIIREDPRNFSRIISDIILDQTPNGIFKSIEVTGGSIGMSMSRLWKGECSIAILAPSTETPWDSTPIMGISRKMGFCFYTIDDRGNLKLKSDRLVRKIETRDEEVIIIHRSAVSELQTHIHKKVK